MGYCLDCGEKFSGRLDKKFCDDYCRGHYNNRLNKNKNATLKEINSILKKNAAILEMLYIKECKTFTQQMFLIAGFDFNFFTHHTYGSQGEVYKCCYNYGYCFVSEDELIVKVI